MAADGLVPGRPLDAARLAVTVTPALLELAGPVRVGDLALEATYRRGLGPGVEGPGDVTPAVGVANAYDALHLAALAIEAAGSTDGDAIRQGFYAIDRYEGLIKTYAPAFTPQRHDAIGPADYVWAQFIDNRIVPVGLKP